MQFISKAHFTRLERLRLQTLWLMASYYAVYMSEIPQPEIFFNATLRHETARTGSLQVTCSIGSTSNPFFSKFVSVNLLRCRYKDEDKCSTSDENFCILFRAFQIGSTIIRYCGCRDLSCHQLSVNSSLAQGYYNITLPEASCSDAGVYKCKVEEVDTHTSEVSQNLDMPPGAVKLFARLESPEDLIQRGSILTLWCRVMSTIPVRFVWIFRSTPSAQWNLITPEMASVRTFSPLLRQRCDIPWTSRMTRYVNVSDVHQIYRCSVMYIYQFTATRAWSVRYILSRAAYKSNSSSHVGSFFRPVLGNDTIGASSIHRFLLAQKSTSQELAEPLPPASVSIVLTCLSVLAVGAVLCLTTILLMESNFVRWTTSFFRSSSNLATLDQNAGRRSQRHLVPALLEWLEYRGAVAAEDEEETRANEAASQAVNNTTPLHIGQVNQDGSWPPLRDHPVQVISDWLDSGATSTDPTHSLAAPQARSGPVSTTVPHSPPPRESVLPTSAGASARTTGPHMNTPPQDDTSVSVNTHDPAQNEVPVNVELLVNTEAPSHLHINHAQDPPDVLADMEDVDLVDIVVLMEDEVPEGAMVPVDTEVPANTEVPPGTEVPADFEVPADIVFPAGPEMSGDTGVPAEAEGNNSCITADLAVHKASVRWPALSVYHVTGSEKVTFSLRPKQTVDTRGS